MSWDATHPQVARTAPNPRRGARGEAEEDSGTSEIKTNRYDGEEREKERKGGKERERDER